MYIYNEYMANGCFHYSVWTAQHCLAYPPVKLRSVELRVTTEMPPTLPGRDFSSPVYVFTRESDGTPAGGVAVTITAGSEAESGGHKHEEGHRPAGGLSGQQNLCGEESITVTTDAGGVATVFYTPSEVSGVYHLKATCQGSCEQTKEPRIEVKVQGLVQLAGSANYNLVGEVAEHPDNHYVTESVGSRAEELAVMYHQKFAGAPLLHYNDASVEWGGLFDIGGDWVSPHKLHREGKNIDVRANDQPGSIPSVNFKEFKSMALRKLCTAGLHGMGQPEQHFHLDCRGAD